MKAALPRIDSGDCVQQRDALNGPAGMMSLLLMKALYSWLCLVGTLSEIPSKAGRRLFGRNLHLPGWAGLPLRRLKDLLPGLQFRLAADAHASLEHFHGPREEMGAPPSPPLCSCG